MKANIELHINELILRDLPYAHRHSIAAAIEQELTRLIDERGWPTPAVAGGLIPHLQIEDLHMPSQAKPGTIGAQIAQQVYGHLVGNPTGQSAPQHPEGQA